MSVVLEPEVIELPETEVVEEPEEVVILRKAYDLLSDPDRWCQDHDALDHGGDYVQPWDDSAVRWCAVGAIAWASEGMFKWSSPSRLFLKARDRLAEQLPGIGSTSKITEANDNRGYDVIMEAFRKALA